MMKWLVMILAIQMVPIKVASLSKIADECFSEPVIQNFPSFGLGTFTDDKFLTFKLDYES